MPSGVGWVISAANWIPIGLTPIRKNPKQKDETNNNNYILNGKTLSGEILAGNQAANNICLLTGSIYLASDANISSWWNDKTLKLAGLISGPGGLTFDLDLHDGTGAGGRYVLTNNANTYLGNTTVNGRLGNGNAYLILGAHNTLPTSTILTLNCADLILSGFNQTVAGFNGTNTQTSLPGTVYTTTGSGNRADQVVNYSVTNATFTINNASSNRFFGVLGGTGANENNFVAESRGRLFQGDVERHQFQPVAFRVVPHPLFRGFIAAAHEFSRGRSR